MDRQELLYRGAVIFGDDDAPTPDAELWMAGRTVIGFVPASGDLTPRIVLHDVTLERDTAGLLVVNGTEGTARAAQQSQPQGAWVGKILRFEDGTTWEGATIEWSNIGVKVVAGSNRLDLLGARTYVEGARKFIRSFGGELADIDVTDPAGTCGPCGRG